jgi:hypothetical protein
VQVDQVDHPADREDSARGVRLADMHSTSRQFHAAPLCAQADCSATSSTCEASLSEKAHSPCEEAVGLQIRNTAAHVSQYRSVVAGPLVTIVTDHASSDAPIIQAAAQAAAQEQRTQQHADGNGERTTYYVGAAEVADADAADVVVGARKRFGSADT